MLFLETLDQFLHSEVLIEEAPQEIREIPPGRLEPYVLADATTIIATVNRSPVEVAQSSNLEQEPLWSSDPEILRRSGHAHY